jgi:tRNA/rRNA methyltransferase
MKHQSTHILLNEVEGPINLGSICRAMANTGFAQLRYTGPINKDDFQAGRFALHATDILESAHHAEDFGELIKEIDILFGFSPREPWPDGRNLDLDQFHTHYQEAQSEGRTIGLLFGNEAHGLANEHLARCTYRVALPAHEDYPSLNLSQAVMVVLWECRRKASKQTALATPNPERATAAEKEALVQNIRGFLDELEFLNPQNPDHLWMEILPIFKARDWTSREITLLHAIFGKSQSRHRALKRKLPSPDPET